eukprot:6080-Heterococcus_DN1.PRE.2
MQDEFMMFAAHNCTVCSSVHSATIVLPAVFVDELTISYHCCAIIMLCSIYCCTVIGAVADKVTAVYSQSAVTIS